MRSFTNRTVQSALLALTATLGVSAAEARDVPGGFVRLGGETAPPRGFVEMCASGVEPGFCSATHPKVTRGGFATAGLRDHADRLLAPTRLVAQLVDAAPSTSPMEVRKDKDCTASQADLPVRLGFRAGALTASPFGGTKSNCPGTSAASLSGDIAWGGIAVSSLPTRQAAPLADLRPAVLQDAPHWNTPSAASPAAPADRETLSPAEQKAMLQRINRNVNYRVRQRSDQDIYGVGELWRPTGIGPGAVGDCEDLAIEKRAELVAAGFPANRLAFAVVYSHAAGLHTVLVARMGNEDVVLDGRSSMIVGWAKAPYSWISVQSMDDPMIWHNAA